METLINKTNKKLENAGIWFQVNRLTLNVQCKLEMKTWKG